MRDFLHYFRFMIIIGVFIVNDTMMLDFSRELLIDIIWPILLLLVLWVLPSCLVIFLINKHWDNIEKELNKWIWLKKEKLKNGKIGDNWVIVEYFPPKWLNPTEVWFLYDSKVWKADVVCMIYKWANMWLVSLDYEWWKVIVKKLSAGQFWMPEYEYNFWNIVFKKSNVVKFPNKRVYWKLGDVKDDLMKYCEKMWRISRYSVHFSLDDLNIFLLVKNLKKNSYIPFWRLIWLSVWYLMIISWFVLAANANRIPEYLVASSLIMPVIWLFVVFGFSKSLSETEDKRATRLTESWKKIIAKIYWYKQFLESCEENQLEEFMRQDPLYIDKTLPYAIALGLKDTISKKIPKNVISNDTSIVDVLRLEKIL